MNTKYIIALLAGSLMLLASCTNDADVVVTPNDDNATVIESTDTTDDMDNQEEGVMIGGAMMVPSNDIVVNAMNSEDHTTLVAAVQAADLVEALKGEGPFTVFAPTNDAFDALPDGTVDTLLMSENKGDLTNVLTYHVVPGAYTSADLSDGLELTTLQGDVLTFSYDGDVWMVNGATIEIADAMSSNGVTHSIDGVLLPSMEDESMNDDDMMDDDEMMNEDEMDDDMMDDEA